MKLELRISDHQWTAIYNDVEELTIRYRAGLRRRLYIEEIITDLDFEPSKPEPQKKEAPK